MIATRELAERIDSWMSSWDQQEATRPGVAYFVAQKLIDEGLVEGQ